jgi:hypothetical protein
MRPKNPTNVKRFVSINPKIFALILPLMVDSAVSQVRSAQGQFIVLMIIPNHPKNSSIWFAPMSLSVATARF